MLIYSTFFFYPLSSLALEFFPARISHEISNWKDEMLPVSAVKFVRRTFGRVFTFLPRLRLSSLTAHIFQGTGAPLTFWFKRGIRF